jgi:hypothetical protein
VVGGGFQEGKREVKEENQEVDIVDLYLSLC